MTMTKTRKLVFTGAAALGLLGGAAGIANAAAGPSHAPPTTEVRETDDPVVATGTDEADEANESDVADEQDGVDCADGIDAATGAECDGGPAANLADDPTEDQADEADEVDGVDCEDGIDATTGADCDGGPAANQDNGAEGPEGAESD